MAGTAKDNPLKLGLTGATRAQRLVAIDPGGVHVGVATFVGRNKKWECTDAFELNPEGWVRLYTELLTSSLFPHHLVVEEFRLYGHLALEQTGSSMDTSQLIGWTRFATMLHNDPLPEAKMTVVAQQPAQIKKPAQAVLRSKGIRSMARRKKAGGHAFDAELHGWFYILGFLKQEAQS